MSNDKFQREVTERLQLIEQRLRGTDHIRNIALAIAGLCLLAAGFSVGYAIQSRQALNNQVDTNQVVLCAQGRSTAAAYRKPFPRETRRHFTDRMLAQQATLLSLTTLDCSALPGYATFPYQRGKALQEIEAVLHRLNPQRFPASIAAPAESTAPVIAAVPDLPASSAPANGGGSGESDPPGGHGDSPGGSGNSSPPKPKGKPPNPVPPSTPTSPVEEPVEPQEPEASRGRRQQSIVSPVFDQTCSVRALARLLCTSR